MHKRKNIILWILLCLALPSCQTLPQKPVSMPVKRATAHHTVAPGETLWRISTIYDVPLASIMSANQLDDKTQVKMGQVLTIPQATAPHQPITLFPSRKWKNIIIHHTAAEGSALTFHKSHLAKGWDRGVGYHFVINTGHGEKPDGFVEGTPRWLKQEDGAHCKASDMNTKGIGISLVGNFSEEKVSPAQMEALAALVNTLRKYYKIPTKNILGHKQVRESNTECPGNNFPWKEFKKKLK
mgnify:CR=1 FL=1